MDAPGGHTYLHSCAHSEWSTHTLLHRFHWNTVSFEVLWWVWVTSESISNLWIVWIFLFLQCIVILANGLFGKRLGGRFIMVDTFGNSANTFLRDPGFNKGFVNWLRTGNWLRGSDSPQWLFKSDFWLPDLEFPVTLIKQYSGGLPNYYITRDFTIKYPLPNNSVGQGFLIIGMPWLPLSIDMFFLSLVKHHQVATHRFHHPLWNEEAHLNGGTYDHTWSAGNPYFEMPVGHWVLLATVPCKSLVKEVNWKQKSLPTHLGASID